MGLRRARVAGAEPQGWAIFTAILFGFFTTVLFYVFGQIGDDAMTGLTGLLTDLAALPGDPFERIFPWLIPLLLVFGFRQGARSAPAPS